MNIISTPKEGELKLTPDEEYLVRMYRLLNDETQGIIVRAMGLHAESPLLRKHPSKPTLSLVEGRKA